MLISRTLCLTGSIVKNHISFPQFNVKLLLRKGYVGGYCGVTCRALATQSSNPPDNSEIIYRGYLASRMKAVKVFSLTTSLTGIAAQPIIYEQASKLGGAPVMVLMCGFVGFFTFVTPILLHFITRNYVTEISYNRDTREYTATTISLVLMKKYTKFQASDVHVPDVPGMFTSFLVGKVPLFVEPTAFADPEHYVKMMGYDKPIDFRLDSQKDLPGSIGNKSMTDKKR